MEIFTLTIEFSLVLQIIFFVIALAYLFIRAYEFSCLIGQVIFNCGVKPSLGQYFDGEILGWGYLKIPGKDIHIYGQKAFLIPLGLTIKSEEIYNKKFAKNESDKVFI